MVLPSSRSLVQPFFSPSGIFFRPESSDGVVSFRHNMLVSDKTFRKYANNMTIEVFDAMRKELENTYVFISLDPTPGMDRRTFISRRFTFIDAKGTFQSLHFGVLNVDGALSADQYRGPSPSIFRNFPNLPPKD